MKKKVVGVLLMVAVADIMLAGCGNSAVQAVSSTNWVSKVNAVEFDTEFVEVATAQIAESLESLEVTENEEEVIEEIEEIIEEVDEVKETVKPESAAEKPVETTAPAQEVEAPVEEQVVESELAFDGGDDHIFAEGDIIADTDLLPLVNADRTANGVGELTWSSELEQYCKDRIPTIVYNDANGLWIHTGLTQNENIARGAWSSDLANAGWIHSPEHHDNRLNSSFTQYAAACYYFYDANGELHTFWIEAFK